MCCVAWFGVVGRVFVRGFGGVVVDIGYEYELANTE